MTPRTQDVRARAVRMATLAAADALTAMLDQWLTASGLTTTEAVEAIEVVLRRLRWREGCRMGDHYSAYAHVYKEEMP